MSGLAMLCLFRGVPLHWCGLSSCSPPPQMHTNLVRLGNTVTVAFNITVTYRCGCSLCPQITQHIIALMQPLIKAVFWQSLMSLVRLTTV